MSVSVIASPSEQILRILEQKGIIAPTPVSAMPARPGSAVDPASTPAFAPNFPAGADSSPKD